QGMPPFEDMTVAQAREVILGFKDMQAEPPPIGSIEDRTIPGPAGSIPVRVYTPTNAPLAPVVVYFMVVAGPSATSTSWTSPAERLRTPPAAWLCRSSTAWLPRTSSRRLWTIVWPRRAGWPSAPPSLAPTPSDWWWPATVPAAIWPRASHYRPATRAARLSHIRS